jgi:hypothetical protein
MKIIANPLSWNAPRSFHVRSPRRQPAKFRVNILEPGSAKAIRRQPEAQIRVLDQLAAGLLDATGWPVTRDVEPGWIGLICPDEPSALWLTRAITAEQIAVKRQGEIVCLPAGPDFQLNAQIESVVTTVAKTHRDLIAHLTYIGLAV